MQQDPVELVMQFYNISRETALWLYEDEIIAAKSLIDTMKEQDDSDN
jgi:hypothetical protein